MLGGCIETETYSTFLPYVRPPVDVMVVLGKLVFCPHCAIPAVVYAVRKSLVSPLNVIVTPELIG
jgi:hypothetical protein